MDSLSIESGLRDILLTLNKDKPYVTSAQIHQFLDATELKFNVFLDSGYWNTVRLFISKYPDLEVDKNIFLEFLDDLLQVDLVKYLSEKIDHNEQLQRTSSLGSPLRLSENQPDEIQITGNVSTKPSICDYISASPMRTERLSKKKPRRVIRISIFGLLRSFLSKFTAALPWINVVLFLFVIALLLLQNINPHRHIFPVLKRIFLYSSTDDLYWWQEIPWLEKRVWKFLEWMNIEETEPLQR